MNRLLVQLGRTGDIINLLPLAHHAHLQGERIGIMAAKDFADVIDGCSYVEKVVFDGGPNELDRAMEQAKLLCPDVICTQVNGPPDAVKRHAYQSQRAEHARTESFQKEAWLLAGKLDLWKTQPPLVFDQRNPDREAALFGPRKRGRPRKIMLVGLEGTSSPFQYKKLAWELLKGRFPDWRIVDLSTITAERVYDLLALYERARVLVVCDNALLHLAYAATNLPVVALINDKPNLWHGSVWRPNHIFHCRYGDFPNRAVEMLETLKELVNDCGKGEWFACKITPKIIHLWSEYKLPPPPKSETRWGWSLSDWIPTPLEVGAAGRDTQTVFKTHNRFPFVKDGIRNALLRATDDDLICLTDPDVSFTPGLTPTLFQSAPCFCRKTVGGDYSPSAALFAFTKRWWAEHQTEYPDMIWAGRNWRRILWELIKLHGGTELPAGTVYQ